MTEELTMSFDPHTIEHLGLQMYSSIPVALAELVANSYDALANEVHIILKDSDKDKKEIIVMDDGVGMTFEDINNKYLRIGRKRREEEKESIFGGRKITGKKGLGKLALFGIGKNIQVSTKTQNMNNAISFNMDWNAIMNENKGEYKPVFTEEKPIANYIKGTNIILTEIKRKSEFNFDFIKIELAKMFNFSVDNFKIFISKNNDNPEEITKEMKYASLNKQFEYKIEDIVREIPDIYKYKDNLRGKIITTHKPLKMDDKGIILYANGRLANAPSFFKVSDSGHFYAYTTGYIEIDFIDDISEKELISTNRQSLNWDNDEETLELREYLQKIIRLVSNKWRKDWKIAKTNKVSEKISSINKINIEKYIKTISTNEEIRKDIANLIDNMTNDELDIDKAIENIQKLLPPYLEYHYRFLHKNIQEVVKDKYQKEEYYSALQQACIKYINSVKIKANLKNTTPITETDRPLMRKVFGNQSDKILKVLDGKKKADGTSFNSDTISNLEDAQATLSEGVVCGYRNPLSHETDKDLKEAEIITEKHCLDALGLLSLLFERLDNIK
ncbi:MAG: hypothetical protein Ta2D_07820 [Rickettsiales bacterium]|nr:MAG: hypothetical protein Ta2D_07820 [Rickettsiales bacterium]